MIDLAGGRASANTNARVMASVSSGLRCIAGSACRPSD
jgi:hypothetical protein